ncbi:hypothetical protein [uncultured Desulfobacter sp.]|uniref:hypothetical protein n=1 Tax=uncultured Desulfobacter sp. TaxID=240139 RepID=UPI0029F4978C|nr:hypothetical protein [uncultured Desulfobacter sp.]
MRVLCFRKGDSFVCDHLTFSLLSLVLVPYRQLTLKFMVLAVLIRVRSHQSLTRVLDAIEDELNHLDDIADFLNASSLIYLRYSKRKYLKFCLISRLCRLLEAQGLQRQKESAFNGSGIVPVLIIRR